MEKPTWRQKTIEDAIREGRKGKHVAAQYHLLKCIALDRPNIEHKLLVKLMLHAGLDRIDDPVWTLPDDEVMEWVKCKRAAFLKALRSCSDDYLLSYSGPTTGRKYRVCYSNLVDQMRVEHQVKFYEILGYETAQIRLLIGAKTRPEIPSDGTEFHHAETTSTTWNPVPPDGNDFHLMEFPNKEEEQREEQVQEHFKQQLQTARCGKWGEVETRLVGLLGDWQPPLAALKERVEPQHAIALIDVFEESSGIYGERGPGILHRRLLNCHPQRAPEAGWPEPELSRNVTRCRELYFNALRFLMKEQGSLLDKARLQRWFVAEAKPHGFTEAEAKQAMFAARDRVPEVIASCASRQDATEATP